MIFALAVHGAPYATQAHQHALKFAAAALSAGHSIKRVFFYHEGVYAALAAQITPQDENDILTAWQQLAAQHELELAVCIANGIKRGVLSESEAQRYAHPAETLAPGFELVGLGQLIEALSEADRYVEFPA